MTRSEYRITVKTFKDNILTYHVQTYEIEDGHVCFYDDQDDEQKRFPTRNVQIEGGNRPVKQKVDDDD